MLEVLRINPKQILALTFAISLVEFSSAQSLDNALVCQPPISHSMVRIEIACDNSIKINSRPIAINELITNLRQQIKPGTPVSLQTDTQADITYFLSIRKELEDLKARISFRPKHQMGTFNRRDKCLEEND